MEGIGLMKYSVETTERFDKEFKKLDKYTQRMIKAWIDKNLNECEESPSARKRADSES